MSNEDFAVEWMERFFDEHFSRGGKDAREPPVPQWFVLNREVRVVFASELEKQTTTSSCALVATVLREANSLRGQLEDLAASRNRVCRIVAFQYPLH